VALAVPSLARATNKEVIKIRIAQIKTKSDIEQVLKIYEEFKEVREEVKNGNDEKIILECLDLITATFNLIFRKVKTKKELKVFLGILNAKLTKRSTGRKNKKSIRIKRWWII